MPCKGTVGDIRRGYQPISSRCIDYIYIVHKYFDVLVTNPIATEKSSAGFTMDPGPSRALRSSGAGNLQMLAYRIIPQSMPQFLTYLLYRWEVVIRTTVVVGFVSAGGLGRDFRLSLSFFQYTDVALMILWYLVLVIAVGLLSAFLRRMVRAG